VNYNQQYRQLSKTDWAPYISVTVSSLVRPDDHVTCDALLDTGASHTFIPESILKRMGVEPSGPPSQVPGFAGEAKSFPHTISAQIGGYNLNEVDVWSWSREFILVGRTWLNLYYIHFNGPDLEFFLNRENPDQPQA
jgi:predicted aspartyl protease